MSTNNLQTTSTTSARPAAAPQTSPARLVLLLGLLALVIGAYAYDFLVAKPWVDASEKKIDTFVEGRNRLGVKESALVTSADIQKELGVKPTVVEKHPEDNYEIEYYCGWGPVPVMNMRRHYIAIVYVGSEPRHFSSQHKNEKPPREALPIPEDPVPASDEPLPPESTPGEKKKVDSDAAAPKDADAPAGKDSESPAKEAAPAEGKGETADK